MVAYFSLEFGIDSNIPTYAGGLGILAGDTMLQAADDQVPMVGIGMMYKGRRFIQKIDKDGMQYEEATPFRLEGSSFFRRVEVGGRAVRFQIQVGDELVWAEAYQQRLADMVTLYLLTADVEGNSEYWRNLFDEIYWGNDEEQIKERVFFGVGGVSLLEALKIKPTLYHFQEGRPALASLALMEQEYRKNPRPFSELHKSVKEKIVYTNHTLVASGVHSYDKGIMEKYIAGYAQRMGATTQDILNLGLQEDNRFHTTRFALNVSKMASGVSKPHTALAKKQWPDYEWVAVTNGVNHNRWQKREFANAALPSQELWSAHLVQKHSLMREVTARTGFGYDHNWFVVSWARRVSGYKQLPSLFADVDRLAHILSHQDRPIMLLIAGKAHPGDPAGKQLIKTLISHMSGPLNGHAMFIPNYDIALSTELVSGSDMWLNTPEVSREACGTSGMKAISNGVLSASVSDGWVAEVNWENMGWVLDPKDLTDSLYTTISAASELYYKRDSENIPHDWIERMKRSILTAEKYSTKRMLEDYKKKLYESVG